VPSDSRETELIQVYIIITITYIITITTITKTTITIKFYFDTNLLNFLSCGQPTVQCYHLGFYPSFLSICQHGRNDTNLSRMYTSLLSRKEKSELVKK
jgi:hypothetical protein